MVAKLNKAIIGEITKIAIVDQVDQTLLKDDSKNNSFKACDDKFLQLIYNMSGL